ncbi:MAG: phage GP46 family protein [Spirochaetes bacterium]|nr:phage GP46 family protein [Spirochaetota bacterium]
MSELRQGDLYVYDTADGGEITVRNGEPVMDGGLENAVYLSLFGHADDLLWMNEYFEESEKMSGEFNKFVSGSVLTAGSVMQAEEVAKKALKWMIEAEICDTIEASVTVTGKSQSRITIELLKDETVLVSSNYEINWMYQKNDPASGRK